MIIPPTITGHRYYHLLTIPRHHPYKPQVLPPNDHTHTTTPHRPQLLPPNDHTTQYISLCDLSIYCKRVFLLINCGIADNIFSRFFAKLFQCVHWRSFIGAEISSFLCFQNNFTCFSLGWLKHWKWIVRICSVYLCFSSNEKGQRPARGGFM